MLEHFTEAVGGLVQAVIDILTSSFEAIVGIFYDGETGFTVLGYFLLLGLSMSLIWIVFKVIRGLIKR